MKVRHRNPILRELAVTEAQVMCFQFGGVTYVVTVDSQGKITQAKRRKVVLLYNQLPFGFVDQFYSANPEFRPQRPAA